MLLGLDGDPYSYDDITDNSLPFKIRNKGKENEYIQFSTYSIPTLVFVEAFLRIICLL
jgi:hypothetical protein